MSLVFNIYFALIDFLFLIAALVIVITIHEFSHAWAASRLGDPTAKYAGRLSLNPLRHLDPLGTLMMFLIHIGWGKPVPVNPSYFKNPLRDEALVAFAGPLSNLVLAVVCAVPVKYLSGLMIEPIFVFFNVVLDVSLILFAFNMLPFPPLDGSKFLGWLVPRRYRDWYEDYLNRGTGYFLIFLLIDRFFLVKLLGFSILEQFVGVIFSVVKAVIFLGS